MDEAPICALGGAMFKLPGKLDGLLRHGHMLPNGAECEIPLIKRDLEEIISILQDHISRSEDPSVMVNCWMKEVRELSYDIEDCIDQYEHSADSKSKYVCKIPRRKFTSRKTNRLSEKLKQRLWMANKIREFSARVQEALQRHQMYIGRTTTTTYDASLRYLHHKLYREAADPVGIDAPMNKLEEWLIKDGEQKLKVVSIVGVGGIGKTTLANKLYCKLGGQFDCRAFLRLSQKPDMRRLLISMLSQVRPHHHPDTWKVHNLIADIKTHLQDKRYLIVVDDVWATSTWDIINRALPDDNRSSRILLTTEIEDVAHKCCGYDSKYVFMMKPLGGDDARKLFFNTAFGPQHECPPELSEVSNSIIRKCGGLPLSTVTIASLLASQMGKPEQWDHVHRSLGYGLGTNTTLEGMKQVLNLCYNNLPHHLKACMLYLSIYEEDHIIWKGDLVKQWIAEGFICATEDQDKEEISGSYFDELVSRRMIQPIHINDNDEVLSCVVHHMVLNLITYKSIEENFVIAIDHSQTTARLVDKVRRLSLHFSNAEYATQPTNMRLSQIRTLAFFGVSKCLPSILELRLVQVLILHFWGDEESISLDLTRISKLIRLKYLEIACNVTLELRTQMQGLQYLETLKIDARASAVPSDIIHLPGLLHLNLPAETNLPNGIGHIASLLTLRCFDISGNSIDNVRSLGELINLRDLQLTCSTTSSGYLECTLECLGSILGKLSNLKSLTLVPSRSSYVNTVDAAAARSMSISCDGLSSVSSPPALLQRLDWLPRLCILASLPKWIGQLGKLCILKIGVRELARNDVDVLSGLPALTVLSLYVRTKPPEMIVFDKEGFSVLKYFKFRCSVPCLKFEADAMPNLRKLKLGFNALGADQHGTAAISIEHLLGLREISAKIGGAKADAESTLMAAVTNHPSNPRINVQLVDCIFYGDESRSMGTKEREHRTIEEQDKILEEDPDECYRTQDEDSGGDENKQDDSSRVEGEISATEDITSAIEDPDASGSNSLAAQEQESKAELRRGPWTVEEDQMLNDYIAERGKGNWNALARATGGEAIQALNLVRSVLGKICSVMGEHRRLKGKLKNGLESIKREMRMIIENEEKNQGATQTMRFLELQELAYDIEDFIDGLWEPGAFGPILTAIGLDPRPQDLDRIDHFKDSIERVRKWQPSASPPCTPPAEFEGIAKPKDELVGIAEAKDELLELLSVADGQPRQLRVISIVGCRGLGKTALARAVYDDPVVFDAFPCRAWVVASECNDAEGLGYKILQQVRPAAAGETTFHLKQPITELHDILKDNRYLVVVDDVQRAEAWKEIEHAFPKNGNSSRMIVTTSLRSVANACSSGNYVYTMQYLDQAKSKRLLWRKFYSPEELPPSLVDGSKSILDKCDGLPLALISVANYLDRKRPQLTRDYCENVGQNLGYHLAAGKESAFGEMKRALMECFDSLPDHDHRSCLLSVSFFPRGHRINRKSLIRRWIAEGLTEEKFARGCFDELIDRSIIEPVLVCNGTNKVVERYQVRSVMMEFIIHMSISNNFINLIHKDEPRLNKDPLCRVRRLSVQYSSNEAGGWVTKEIDLSSIRSLTICSGYIFDFKDCKLLRVLDLEGCNGITERVLDVICKLLFLKYLSLRGSDVLRIPKRMGKLYDLETLDIRETQVENLPVEVIMLPRLAHLFGRFKLSHVSGETREKLENGSLQTLAGVVIDKEYTGFEQLMLHARKLSKVKIWYNATPRGNNSTHPNKKAKCINSTVSSLLLSLQKRFIGSKALDTLSIDSSDLSKGFLRSLQAPCAIRTIKLRGKLERFPDSNTLRQLRNLNKLHLFSTGLSSEVLSELQTLRCLECLKLAEDRDGFSGSSFVVRRDGFPSLQRLCFEAPKLPLLQIEQGAMTKLTSLQMLCQEFADELGVTGIEHLQRLDELILYSSASDAVMEAWKKEAIQHQNRPYVKKQQINGAA